MRPTAAFESGSAQALDQSELHIGFARSSLEKVKIMSGFMLQFASWRQIANARAGLSSAKKTSL